MTLRLGSEYPAFSSQNLSALDFGTYELGVPLIDGNVQLMWYGAHDDGLLDVTRDLEFVTIRNADGAPLQVVYNGKRPNEGSVGKHPLFATPVEQLTLQEISDIDWRVATEDAVILGEGILESFVELVGIHSLKKQVKLKQHQRHFL